MKSFSDPKYLDYKNTDNGYYTKSRKIFNMIALQNFFSIGASKLL
jgi:hypothetical protein